VVLGRALPGVPRAGGGAARAAVRRGRLPRPGKEGRMMIAGDGRPLSIVIIGASGDLARRKIVPALFALYCQDLLPERFAILGFARTPMSHAEFRQRITEFLTCRYAPGARCADRMERFLARCHYAAGRYESAESYLDLYTLLKEVEGGAEANRLFYMAIPPNVFLDAARAVGSAGLVACDARRGWSRVVIEKPFGRDRESSDRLVDGMAGVFTEEQTFRIDHYLGKEVVQNLMVLRFANLVFEPLWNNLHVQSVTITWKETLGVEGRGGYFDQYGILRDVVQNHLLQILALLAMEEPFAMDSHSVRNEKVRLLQSIPPLRVEDLVIGQYGPGQVEGRSHRGYAEEDSVPPGSRTPTYAAAVLQVRNRRWNGVPFLIEAGKALDRRINEIRIRFRDVPRNLFGSGTRLPENELVIRIQPDEAIHLRILNKVPGLQMNVGTTDLNLTYSAAFGGQIPDAYECLLLDVLLGDRSLFIREDELARAWDIFTPVLHQIESERRAPELYPFGSTGPAGATALAARYGLAL
jgi:glucose-6-phosphate 1-dehydrogenase